MKPPKTIRLNFKLIHKIIRNWKREDAKRLKEARGPKADKTGTERTCQARG